MPVRRDDGDLRPFPVRPAGQPASHGGGLLAADPRKGDIGVALRDVDRLEAVAFGLLGDGVAGALPVPDDGQSAQFCHDIGRTRISPDDAPAARARTAFARPGAG
jgi:hypothetical protein